MQEFADFLNSVVCHQLPDRTILVQGADVGLCHRCLGLHSGLVIAWLIALAFVSNRPRAAWSLAIAPFLLLAHWMLEATFGYASSSLMRLVTGAAAGASAGIFFRWYAPWRKEWTIALVAGVSALAIWTLVRSDLATMPRLAVTAAFAVVLGSVLVSGSVGLTALYRVIRSTNAHSSWEVP